MISQWLYTDLSNSAMSCHSLSFGTLSCGPSVAISGLSISGFYKSSHRTEMHNYHLGQMERPKQHTMMCEPFSARLCCTFSGFKGEFKVPEVTCKRNGTKSHYKKNARAKVDLCCSKAAFMLTFEFTNRFDKNFVATPIVAICCTMLRKLQQALN